MSSHQENETQRGLKKTLLKFLRCSERVGHEFKVKKRLFHEIFFK